MSDIKLDLEFGEVLVLNRALNHLAHDLKKERKQLENLMARGESVNEGSFIHSALTGIESLQDALIRLTEKVLAAAHARHGQ
jgi:hypothetical protein